MIESQEHGMPIRITNFDFDDAVKLFILTQDEYVNEHKHDGFDYVATGAFVFDRQDRKTPRILLLQRSARDSMPNRWEVPGGGCQNDDDSILSAVARELWEEAGLKTKRIVRTVGAPYLFQTRSGKRICKFDFIVEVHRRNAGKFDVKLNPEEHQSFLWASEDEVRCKKSGDTEMEFTTTALQRTIIESFEQIAQARQQRSSQHASLDDVEDGTLDL